MSNFDHRYKASEIDLIDDLREQGHSLGQRREDLLDSMLNLILNHKREIQKVPGTTTLASAKKWCEKRPGSGFRAGVQNLGGDEEPEVIVYDKAGKPYIINGYKLKPSDYGVRKFYKEAVDKDPDSMVGTSMREWATEQVWPAVREKGNMWNQTITKNNVAYDKLKNWGYRMPTKPKKQATPYSIFSKLIAGIVKGLFNEPNLYLRLGSVFGIQAKPGPECYKFFNKIVSPISVYRFLYLRLIEQKYFWSVKETIATRNINTYDKFKRFLKENKNTFRNWFLTNIMTGPEKENFKSGWVSPMAALDVLVKGSIQTDGSDIQDGIVFLLSVANLKDKTPVVFTYGGEERSLTFRQLLIDNEAAAMFNAVIGDKKNTTSKVCKKRIAKWKDNSEKSSKAYFKDERAQKLFFEDEHGRQTFLEAMGRAGLPNATDPESAARQQASGSSPVKKIPVVEPQAEDVGVSADDEELKQLVGEDDDEESAPIPALAKGQKKMTDFFQPEE